MRNYTMTFFAAISFSSAFAQTEQVEVIDEQSGMTPIVDVTDFDDINRSELIKDSEVIYLGNSDEQTKAQAHRKLINQFYEDQFRHAQDPEAPYFMLMSRNNKLAMGIGGDLNFIGSYDFDGSQDG